MRVEVYGTEGEFSHISYLLNPLRACPHIRPLPVNAIVACPSLV